MMTNAYRTVSVLMLMLVLAACSGGSEATSPITTLATTGTTTEGTSPGNWPVMAKVLGHYKLTAKFPNGFNAAGVYPFGVCKATNTCTANRADTLSVYIDLAVGGSFYRMTNYVTTVNGVSSTVTIARPEGGSFTLVDNKITLNFPVTGKTYTGTVSGGLAGSLSTDITIAFDAQDGMPAYVYQNNKP